MPKPSIRRAIDSEMSAIYMMGFDTWGKGDQQAYLAFSRDLPIYKKGRWYVLAEGETLLSSMIVYPLKTNEFGFGSIATPPELRGKGFASIMIKEVMNLLQIEVPQPALILYSDIDPRFYETFGFVRLPQELQKYKTTTCMVQGKDPHNYFHSQDDIPDYF